MVYDCDNPGHILLFLFVCSPVFLPLGAMEWSMIVTLPGHIHLVLFVCSPVFLPLGATEWSMIVTLPGHIHLFLFVCSPVFLPLGAMEWSMIVTILVIFSCFCLSVVQCFFLLVPWNSL